MALDLLDQSQRAHLQKAVRYSYENAFEQREKRQSLIEIYRGESALSHWLGPHVHWHDGHYHHHDHAYGTLLNLFLQFVRAHLVTLAYQMPKYAVNARTLRAKGFDKRIQAFLRRYGEILDLQRVFRQCALDSAFGNAIVKVISSVAPKGITSPVAPRAYRISPDLFIADPTASVPEEASFLADVYLVPLNEARSHPSFDPEHSHKLQPWREASASDMDMFQDGISDLDALSEEHTRLIDVYIPSSGVIVTWAAASDTFANIHSDTPLQVLPTPINPYSVCQLLQLPNSLEEISRLWSLKGLHLLANDMFSKSAGQGRRAKRNPVDKVGNESDFANLSTAADGQEVFLEDPSSLDLYQVPGPDASIVQLAQMSAQMFSQYGGNIELILGQSAGAPTARQTQALIGQVSAQSALDRGTFEIFMADVGRKLATLAFYDEALELDISERVPGTRYSYNVGWAPPELLPRVADINEFHFEVVPFSSSFRSPQERLTQLQQASQGILQWMTVAASGAPVNMAAVTESYADAFDLVPDLADWWSGQPPTPAEKAANTYSSAVGPSQGSTVSYQGGLGGGGGGQPAAAEPSPGGLQGGGV